MVSPLLQAVRQGAELSADALIIGHPVQLGHKAAQDIGIDHDFNGYRLIAVTLAQKAG